ncbi:uncharacterized protein LOC100384407 [Zea mays]|uniref:Uncharacterized protein n=1 Tax=Zea mays TaxID=4577 RepID=C0PP31_MAIZE|nr:uncharacterized protein LOC100384407 [Zea mays]ACN36947.1 unknown [Zea mays]|eukprot:NP_001170420.1 uncharacterized protein LOC100384407 [Zea mays]
MPCTRQTRLPFAHLQRQPILSFPTSGRRPHLPWRPSSARHPSQRASPSCWTHVLAPRVAVRRAHPILASPWPQSVPPRAPSLSGRRHRRPSTSGSLSRSTSLTPATTVKSPTPRLCASSIPSRCSSSSPHRRAECLGARQPVVREPQCSTMPQQVFGDMRKPNSVVKFMVSSRI